MRRALLLLAAVAAGCGGEGEPAAQRSVLLLSGRDDHGLLVQRTVGLSRWIGGEPETEVPDGTLVAVQATRGEWIQVRTLEGRRASGWVNDFYLRGTAFTQDDQVELLAVVRGRVRVRSLETKRVSWVPRGVVTELPPG